MVSGVKIRGASLMSVLLLITIIILVAATMAGVFTMNMNITQRVSNGDLALAEAEAGISEVLYIITREDADTPAGNSGPSPTLDTEDDPKIDFGLNGETLRSTITPHFSPDEAYHVVTFDSSSSFAHSTNNTTLTNDNGSLDRTIPDGKFHIVSTGYCKGQYRTVECVIEKPPFPFGLATSGPINSSTPLTVKGVSSLANLQNDDIDRPGHILCNSPAGVTIQQISPPKPTEISGFVKSAGDATIAQPAVVRGGVRTFADISTLADINIQSFKNQGQPGVVDLLDDNYHEAQNMDIMYFFSGNTLTYESRVDMNQAMLYVEGDLVIRGPVTGEGLIVVDGNATFESGTALSGANKMAVLASGDIVINGNNNFFSGLVYSEGNLIASNVTIVGNTIINSQDTNKGQAQLDNVGIVSNEETADMTIVVTSSSAAVGQNSQSRYPFPIMPQIDGNGNVVMGNLEGGGGRDGWPAAHHTAADIAGMLKGDAPSGSAAVNSNNLWSAVVDGGGSAIFQPDVFAADAGPILEGVQELVASANEAKSIKTSIDSKKSTLAGMDDDDPDRADIQVEIADLESQLSNIFDDFNEKADTVAEQFYQYGRTHAGPDGVWDDGDVTNDVEQEHRFNLNEYLPESERVKVSFWRVYPRKM